MTNLEPKSTSLLSQLILRKPDRNGQNLSGKVSNIGPNTLYMSKEKGEQGNLCIKIKKNPENSFLLFFICLNLMISTKISKKPAF